MKKTRKYAFGGFEDEGEKDKKAAKEARKVDAVPDGYTEEAPDPSFPNRKYYRREIAAPKAKIVTPNATITVKPAGTPRPSNKRVVPTNRFRTTPPAVQAQAVSDIDRIFTEQQPVVNTPTPVEAFMGDVVVDGSNKAVGRLRNRSRNLAVGAGTNNTGLEAADFMYTQRDVKGAPVDSTRGQFALTTKELQDIFGTGRVMTKDVSQYKSGKPKMANGGVVGANMINSLGGPILDTLTSLLDGTPDYSAQPIVNAATIRNMATPYSRFAMGGTVDDLDEQELYDLQQEADERGMDIEDLLAEKQAEGEAEMMQPEEEQPQDEEPVDNTDEQETSLADAFSGEEYAMGGKAGHVPIEIEGGEVIEHPNGVVQKAQGPAHEQGGIDVNVQKGTKIYSDRLSVDGKTMQERKIKREKTQNKLADLLDENPSSPLKNTIKRTNQISEIEDQQDMALQEVAKHIYGEPEKAAFGGTIRPYRTPTVTGLGSAYTGTLAQTPTMGINPSLRTPIVNPIETEQNAAGLGVGDVIGLGGGLFNAIAPIINTQNAAAATKPRINRFLGFGKNALAANDAAQSNVQTQQGAAQTDLNTSTNSAIARNRNGARSVNTMRALDTATVANANKANANLKATFAGQLNGLLGQRGQLENQKDMMEMRGQTQADDLAAQDMDNYYSNMAQNLTNFGTNLQGIGKSLNVHRSNQDDIDLLSTLSTNGISIGRRNGKLKIVNNK
jgi:hypothetical protein